MLRSLPTLVAIGVLAANAARAETLVFQQDALLPGGAPYAGTQDTEIAEAAPDADASERIALRSDLESFGGQTQALVRFETIFGASPDRIPPGSTISAATLTLEAFNASNLPVGVISIYRMTASWNDGSSWNTLAGGVQVGSETVASADDAHTVESVGTTSFDVTASLAAWSAGESNRGWVLLDDSTDGVEFWSSEYTGVSLRPMLTVEFTPAAAIVEAPSLSGGGLAWLVAGLALAGGAALGRSGRTRTGSGGGAG